MKFRQLVEVLAHDTLFKRDVDKLMDVARKLYEENKLTRKEFYAFGDIALKVRSFSLD